MKVSSALRAALVLSLVSVSTTQGCGSRPALPTDERLAASFGSHSEKINSLQSMFAEDAHLVRIARDFTWLDTNTSWPRNEADWGLSPERWNSYRDAFSSVGCPFGLSRNEDYPGVTFLTCAAFGTVAGGTSKGFAYSETPLSPILDHLDSIAPTRGVRFKRLQDGWYLFLESSG